MKIFWSTLTIVVSATLLGRALESDQEDGEFASWQDVYQVLDDVVADPSAREHLWMLTEDLEALSYDGAWDAFDAVLDLTMDEFWHLSEEALTLSYSERDQVFTAMMAAIAPLPAGVTQWVEIGREEDRKCVRPRTATCGDRKKSICVKKQKQVKKNGVWENVDPAVIRCETAAADR